MLHLTQKKEIIGTAKSAFSINFPFYVFALCVLLAFSAFQCEEEEVLICGVGEYEVIYEAEVKVEAVVCGWGVWENLWFNDGSAIYLQPYSLDESTKAELEKMEIKDGMNLKIQYLYAQKDGRYDGIVVCQAYPGDSNPIKIVSITQVDK